MPAYPYTPHRTVRTVARGLVAVAALLLSALDALITAAIGVPPIAWTARQLGAVIRETYRAGRYGQPSTCTDLETLVYEVEIVDDEGKHR